MLEEFQPLPKNIKLIRELELENKFIIGYIGTHGLAHALDFILKAAKFVNYNVHFIFIGDGAKKRELLELHKKLQLTNITFLPFQPKTEIKKYISILDAALVNLKKSELFKTVIPSKIFENAAMGIPILLGVEGESKQLLEKYDAGIGFEPENKVDFLNKIKIISITENINRYKAGGIKLSKNFDRKKLAKKMLSEIIESCKK